MNKNIKAGLIIWFIDFFLEVVFFGIDSPNQDYMIFNIFNLGQGLILIGIIGLIVGAIFIGMGLNEL